MGSSVVGRVDKRMEATIYSVGLGVLGCREWRHGLPYQPLYDPQYSFCNLTFGSRPLDSPVANSMSPLEALPFLCILQNPKP